MFSPYVLIAAVLGLLASMGVSFGTGWHYGDKGKIAITKYQSVLDEKAGLSADLKKAKEDYANAQTKNAAAKDEGDRALHDRDATIDKQQSDLAALQRKNLAAVADLATARLMLTDATTDAERATRSAAIARDQGTAQSADIAGRLGACKSAYDGLVTSSRVNNAELKRAIARRDACVRQYEAIGRNTNGE